MNTPLTIELVRRTAGTLHVWFVGGERRREIRSELATA